MLVDSNLDYVIIRPSYIIGNGDHRDRLNYYLKSIQNEIPIKVDLVGHSWFFKKEWLSYMVRELPDPKYNTCGEDMHFSYMLQKYLNIKTYVPPHPHNDKEMWGSLKGSEYGGKNSLWGIGKPQHDLTNQYFKEQRLKGWKLVNEK